jgi:GcrA cell cycle regulator
VKVGWTPERIDLLKTLWADGLSASQIAAELGGISRNGVIGKVHRMRLPAKQQTASLRRATKDKADRRKKPRRTPRPPALPSEPLPPERDEDIPVRQRCTIMSLGGGKCHWPVGDPGKPDFFFCGGKVIEGLPYCRYHARRAYQAMPVRRAKERVAA